MIRIATSSIITAIAVYAVHAAADTTPYVIITMLTAAGFAAGSLVMFCVFSEVK